MDVDRQPRRAADVATTASACYDRPVPGSSPHPRRRPRRQPAPTQGGPSQRDDRRASRIRAAVVLPDGPADGRRDDASRRGPRARPGAGPQARSAPVPSGASWISAPGPLDLATGHLRQPPNLPAYVRERRSAARWQGPGAAHRLDRDTNAAILGERAFGAARGRRRFPVPDRVHRHRRSDPGQWRAAHRSGRRRWLELGHLPVDIDGPPSGCGARGHPRRPPRVPGSPGPPGRRSRMVEHPGYVPCANGSGPGQPVRAVTSPRPRRLARDAAAAIMDRARPRSQRRSSVWSTCSRPNSSSSAEASLGARANAGSSQHERRSAALPSGSRRPASGS